MLTTLPGISGSIFPSRFLSTGLANATEFVADPDPPTRRRLLRCWQHIAASCGPATGLRTLFDVAAMPLAAVLGFRADEADFARTRVRVRLRTRRGTPVGCVVLPWALRPSRRWREVLDDAAASGAQWSLIIAPPFVSVIDVRRHASRRSLDFQLPQALDDRSIAAFWTLCRAETFDARSVDDQPGVAPIDALAALAARFQDQVRRDLQRGVVTAIAHLGPALNPRRPTRSQDRFTEALTIVYRVLFLLFAEARELVPRHHPAYGPAYAIGSLCRDALRNVEGSGLWDGLAAVTRISRSGCETNDLIVRPFNGRLFARAAAPSLERIGAARLATRQSRRRDAAMAAALCALGTRPGPAGREEISYADLGVEQLGAVYERVLDLSPDALTTGEPVADARAHSRRRKETGTFYTPQPLADFVVRRTLAPLVRGATSDDILALRIVDPAMGSGAFLVAACRYLSRAYEQALLTEGRCAEPDLDPDTRARIRRDIAARCLAGVDANPVAVQLARLSLWLVTLARDKPLTFLDDRLRIGNSLLGTTPDDLWRVRRGPRSSTPGTPLFDAPDLEGALRAVAQPLRQLRLGREDTVAEVRAKERIWETLAGDRSPIEPWRLACHVWCARWFWPATDPLGPPSSSELAALIDAVLRQDRTLGAAHVLRRIETARKVAGRHQFFHWPLEFADVHYGDTGAARDRPGFDAVIGNPPWEMLRRDDGTSETNSATAPHAATLAFVRQSGHFPSCDRGHLNLYQPFLDRSLSIARPGGRVGLVLPWGLTVDEGASALRSRLLERGAVDALVGFDNAEGLFPIHRGMRFCVLVASPGATPRDTHARFGIRTADEIDDLPEDGTDPAFPIRLNAGDIRQVGGRALRIPDVRRLADWDWLRRVCARFPRLGDRDGWGADFGRELNATEDRPSFGDRGLPVIEGKHIGPFRVDAGASEHHILRETARGLLPDRNFERPRLAYRDVSAPGNRFALIAAVIPADVVTTHTLFCLRQPFELVRQHFLCGLFNSSALNTIVRFLMGSHVTTGLIEGLPIPPWTGAPEQLRISEVAQQLAANPEDADAMAELNRIVGALYN